MTNAAAMMPGAASGTVMRQNTPRGPATIKAASSSRPSTRRSATSVASIERGYNTRPSTSTAAGKL